MLISIDNGVIEILNRKKISESEFITCCMKEIFIESFIHSIILKFMNINRKKKIAGTKLIILLLTSGGA